MFNKNKYFHTTWLFHQCVSVWIRQKATQRTMQQMLQVWVCARLAWWLQECPTKSLPITINPLWYGFRDFGSTSDQPHDPMYDHTSPGPSHPTSLPTCWSETGPPRSLMQQLHNQRIFCTETFRGKLICLLITLTSPLLQWFEHNSWGENITILRHVLHWYRSTIPVFSSHIRWRKAGKPSTSRQY